MNIFDKIKKEWDFSKSVEQNALVFNTKERQSRRNIHRFLAGSLLILGLALLGIYPSIAILFIFIGALTFGSAVQFNNANTTHLSVAGLSATSFVVCYKDIGNSNQGTACAATVSGGVITFGSESVFNAASTEYIDVCKLTSTTFFVAYNDNGSNGNAIIGTVSGTSITGYGSESTFNAANSVYISCAPLSATSVVVVYRDVGNSNRGTGIVSSISGTTISSWGSENVYEADANSDYNAVAALSSTAFVVAYVEGSTGEARIGTVSGTTISGYGTQANYEGGTTNNVNVCALSSTSFVVSYVDAGDSSRPKIIAATISGTTITFGSITTLSTDTSVGTDIVTLSATEIVVVYGINATNVVAKYCTISGTTITVASTATALGAPGTVDQPVVISNLDGYTVVIAANQGSSDGQAIIGQLPLPTNIKTYNTNVKANIKSINTNVIANVKSLNTNT